MRIRLTVRRKDQKMRAAVSFEKGEGRPESLLIQNDFQSLSIFLS